MALRDTLIDVVKRPWGTAFDPLVRSAALAIARARRGQTTSTAGAVLDGIYRDGPLLLGHRGAMARAPENTLGAFAAAIDDGARGVELDVQLSADSVPIVLHDDTLDRTTTGRGLPIRFSAAELGALDASSWFPAWPAEKRERVPTLDEVLAAMPDDSVVNVELKGPTPLGIGLERRTLEVIRRHMGRVNVVVSSFHPAQLLVVQRLAGDVPTGLLLAQDSLLPLRTAWAAPLLLPDAIHPPSRLVDAGFVARAHEAGMRVHVWAVRDDADARRLLDLGVDGLIVDDVAATARVMRI
jgi:glycerophosphoryl diester phosphodiesterase